jgi:hypothetical protein
MYVRLVSSRMAMTSVRIIKYRFNNYMLLIHSELLNTHLCMQFAP